MTIKQCGSAAAIICLWTVLLTSCGGASDSERPTPFPEGVPVVGHRVTVDEAGAMLDFEVALPSFVPRGALQTPDLEVISEEDGRPFYLRAMYWDDASAPPGVIPMRIRLSEVFGDWSLPDAFAPEVIEIRGVEVDFAVGPFEGPYADVMAEWTHNEVGVEAEFYWLTDDKPGERVVTDDMRADALKVIESMIR